NHDPLLLRDVVLHLMSPDKQRIQPERMCSERDGVPDRSGEYVRRRIQMLLHLPLNMLIMHHQTAGLRRGVIWGHRQKNLQHRAMKGAAQGGRKRLEPPGITARIGAAEQHGDLTKIQGKETERELEGLRAWESLSGSGWDSVVPLSSSSSSRTTESRILTVFDIFCGDGCPARRAVELEIPRIELQGISSRHNYQTSDIHHFHICQSVFLEICGPVLFEAREFLDRIEHLRND
ncbi:hypothetical protein B0H14DRAFT_2573847, partial [Mycena olivaceomarginata]